MNLKCKERKHIMNESMTHIIAKQYGISPLPENPVVAMAYVPYQEKENVYSAEQGISEGTMFPELNKPFEGATVGENK